MFLTNILETRESKMPYQIGDTITVEQNKIWDFVETILEVNEAMEYSFPTFEMKIEFRPSLLPEFKYCVIIVVDGSKKYKIEMYKDFSGKIQIKQYNLYAYFCMESVMIEDVAYE